LHHDARCYTQVSIAIGLASHPSRTRYRAVADTRDNNVGVSDSAFNSLASSVFVGRVREAEILRSAMSEAIAGRGRLVVLAGEPGIGKTRLAQETAKFAVAAGARAAWGRCWEGGGAPAFWPWIQLIRECLDAVPSRLLTEANPGLSYIAQIVPVGSKAPSRSLRDPSGAFRLAEASREPGKRFALFDAISNLLKVFAASVPLMIVLDDLHAADEDSLLLLRFVARESQQMRILLVVSYREVEVRRSHERSELIAEISREGTTIPLRGLSLTEVGEFIERNAKLPAENETIFSLHHATDGNPFFLDEILRLVTAGHGSPRTKLDSSFEVPDSVRAAIRRHMAPLAEQTKSVLSIASLIGPEFDQALLQNVSGLTSEQLIETLDESIANSLVSQISGGFDGYRFTHAITAEALRSELSTATRVRLHERIAAAMEKVYAEDLESHLARLAHHYFEALPVGTVEKAVEFARRGAQRARDQLAFAEASRLYAMALRATMVGRRRDENARCELLLEMGENQALGRSLHEARRTFEQAIKIARKLGRSDLLSRAALAVSAWFSSFFTLDTNLKAIIAEAITALGPNDSPIRAALTAGLASEYHWSGEHERGRTLCEEAVAIARRADDRRALVATLWVQNEINWGPADLEARLASSTDIASLAESIGDYQRALRAHEMRFTALLEMGDIPALDAEVQAYTALAEKSGEQFGIVQRLHAALALLKGDFNEAARQTQELLRHAQRRQDPALLACAAILKEFVCTERAQIDPVEIESGRKALVAQSPTMATLARAGLAVFYASTGRPAEARAELESLAKNDFASIRRDWNWLAIICWLSLVCVAVDDAKRAAVAYDLLLPYAERNVTLGWGDLAYGCAGRFLGMLAWRIGRLDDAQTHFEQALVFEQKMGARPWLAYTQVEYARMLLKRAGAGDRERALSLLRDALAITSVVGMKLLELRAAALMTKAGASETIRSATPEINPSGSTDSLTRQQRIVATIMFIDIVDSTQRVAEMNDRWWVEIRERFFQLLRQELSNFGGREIDTSGDGMLAIFGEPAAAIHSAFAMSEGTQKLGLQIRAGIHTGECELVGDDIAGIAVHIGARVANFAAADEVIVSSTVRDLMVGGDVEFADRGTQALKGIPGQWRLYAVEQPRKTAG
jgi:eukaryotic-like serine/threonine-protein kinase